MFYPSKTVITCLVILTFIWDGCTKRDNAVPQGSENWSFVVFSDVQTGYGIYSRLAENISKINPVPAGAFCCGDLMLRGTNEADWFSFMKCSKGIMDKIPFYLARGNHEGNDELSGEILRQHLYFPSEYFYYSIRKNQCLFILLDTQESKEEFAIVGNQRSWLFTQLDAATADTSISHVFIFMHKPLFSQGKHKIKNPKNRDELHSCFLTYKKVRSIFAGHDHFYNKFIKDTLVYITTGGGGGSLDHGFGGDYYHFTKVSFYSDPFRINIKTIGIFYEVIEDFDL